MVILLKDCFEHDCIYGFLVFKDEDVDAREIQKDICRIKEELTKDDEGPAQWTIEDDLLPKLYELYDFEYYDYSSPYDNEIEC